MAAKASLRYFLGIFDDLLKLTLGDEQLQLLIGERKNLLGHLLELNLLILADVVLLTLGKPKNEECLVILAVQNNAAVPLGLAAAWASNPLLDDATAQVSIDLALFGTLYRLPKRFG